MRNFCCISKRFASQRFNLFPGCLLEGRADMVGLRSFRKLYCDIPLALINVMFLSTLLSLLLLLSHSKRLCKLQNSILWYPSRSNKCNISQYTPLLASSPLSHSKRLCKLQNSILCYPSLSLINVMFLSTLLSLLLLLSHILKGCVSFRTVYCDIPLALINVMFLSTLLSLLLLLSVTF